MAAGLEVRLLGQLRAVRSPARQDAVLRKPQQALGLGLFDGEGHAGLDTNRFPLKSRRAV